LRELLKPYSDALLEARRTAKVTRDFASVDKIKRMLTAAGAEVRMTDNGVEVLPTVDFDPAKLEALQ
jgi:cysteinyl-tRNA synthetase